MKTNSITRRSLSGALSLGLLLTQNMIGQSSLPPIPGGTNTSYTTNNYYYPYVPPPSFSYPTSATLLWQLPLNYVCIASPVVGPDGTIYVLSDKSFGWEPNHNLWAVNPDGTIKWQTTIMTTSSGHPYTMSLDVSGTLYVPGSDGQYAINSVDGTTNWMVNIGGQGAAIATNGTIYICPNKVYAISNGVIVWDSGTNAPGGNSVLPVVAADGTIYIGPAYGGTQLSAFNPDGSLKWQAPTPTQSSYYACWPAIGSDGTVYSGGYHFFCAINPTDGAFKWIYTGTSDQVWEQTSEIGSDGTIYVEAWGDTNKLYAFNPDGSVKWTFRMGAYIGGRNVLFKVSSCALATDGEIYVSDIDGMVYSLAPNGTTNWSYQTAGTGLLPPVIGPDGTVYVNSYDQAYLYAFYGPAPVACSPWPEFRKNSRNTASVATASLSLPAMQTNGFQFTISGVSNMPVCPCASSDLANWTNIGQVVLTNGNANFVDTGASNYQYRFYRAWPQ